MINMARQEKIFTPKTEKVMLTTDFPKKHKLRKAKKEWLEYYEPDTLDFDGIVKKIDELVPNNQKVVALSGGKDSSCVLHRLFEKELVDRAFFIKTNVGVQATEDFVIDTCKSYGIPLDIRQPTPHKYIYAALVLEIGFPNWTLHSLIMRVLKYQTMEKYVTEPQFKDTPIVLMSGVRKYESIRRKFNYNQPINVDSGRLWFACPIFYETTEEVYGYFVKNNVKKSPVYEWANTSYECGCGCYSAPGEYDTIKKHAPELAEYLDWLKVGIEKFGTQKAKEHKWWGNGKPYDDAQQVLTEFLGQQSQHTQDVSQMICGAECGAGTMRAIEDI